MENQNTESQKTGFAITSLILGILAFLTGFIVIGFIFGVLAIIFGIIALHKNQGGMAMSIVGIVLGGIGALAGLIFLMVFVSIPALQRSQHDTASKNDVAVVSSSVVSYISNNNGQLPPQGPLSETATVSSSTTSVTVVPFQPLVAPDSGQILVVLNASCNADTSGGTQLNQATTARNYAVVTKLEGNNYYCENS